MPKDNAICRNCGSPYYVCRGCVSIYSYKLITCSPQCFREYMEGQQKTVSEPTSIQVETPISTETVATQPKQTKKKKSCKSKKPTQK